MINSMSAQYGALPSAYQSIENTSKIEVPVPSSVSIYAQFKYVRGVPASSNEQPVSLSRAQIIDNMVSFLNSSTDEPVLDKREEFKVGELEQEVHRVINEAEPQFNSMPGKSGDTGIIFNLTA